MKTLFMIVSILFATGAQAVAQTKTEKEIFTNKHDKNKLKTGLNLRFADALKKRPTSKTSQQPPVTGQPEGTVINNLYRSTSESYFAGWGGVFSMPVDGFAGTLVKDNDGNIYMKDPFATMTTNTWLKLDKAKGDTLVAKGNQPIYQEDVESDLMDFYASRMVSANTGDGALTYIIDKQNPDVKFVYRNDSLIQVSDGIIGMHTADGEWIGFGDIHSVFAVVKDKVADVNPSLQFNDYLMKYVSSNIPDGKLVKVAFDKDDVYLRGAFPNMPEATIIGRKEGNKVVFESNQYLGVDTFTEKHAYFFGGTSKTVADEEVFFLAKHLTFDYDADKMVMTADSAICFNGGNKIMSYIYFFKRPEIGAYTEQAATPRMPEIISFNEFDPDEGYATLIFDYSKFDEKGIFMNPEKLYYKIYKDNEEFTFLPEDYPGLTVPTDELAYDYDDGKSVSVIDTYHSVQIYEDGYSKIGVSCIFKGGGETRESPVAWEVIREDTGMENFGTNQVANTRFTDLSGRSVGNPSEGIFIREDLLTNGTRKYTKVLVK